jgi:hypothetical protein
MGIFSAWIFDSLQFCLDKWCDSGRIVSERGGQLDLAGVEKVKTLFLAWTWLIVAIPCSADVIYVDPNGTGDYPTIQEAIDAAFDGDTVIVLEGTYTGAGNRNIDFGGRAITVRSTNPQDPVTVAATIIDCEKAGCGFCFDKKEGVDSVVSGITITNGDGWQAATGSYAGGINCESASPTLSNLVILNSLGYVGGIGNYNSSAIITNCTFSGNSAEAGAGIGNWESNPTITNCTFSGNASYCIGGMFNYESSPTVTNCVFSGNSSDYDGGAMYNWWKSSPIVTGCTFSGNTAYDGIGGGMINDEYCNPIVTNCTFIGNSASGRGGGMCNITDSSPIVTGCTFSGNSAEIGGGMYNAVKSSPIVTNCILWDNTALVVGNQIYNYPGSSPPVISYCDIDGCGGSGGGWDTSLGTDGGGNIDADPEFVDPNGLDGVIGTGDDNLRLSGDSVCIDTGDSPAVTVLNDLDGQHRIMDGDGNGEADVDIGAYEYYGPVYEPTVIYVNSSATGGNNNGMSWEDAFISLQGALGAAIIGDEIWVATGTYTPDLCGREASFQMKNYVGIYGGFPDTGDPDMTDRDTNQYETILSGDLLGNDNPDIPVEDLLDDPNRTENCYHVFYHPAGTNLDSTAILNGFTITGGNSNSLYSHNNGGGIYNLGSNPTVTNCTFSGNSSYSNGGGMFNWESSPIVTNCIFRGNFAARSSGGRGGGMCNYYSKPKVTNCIFSGNSAKNYGGGMYNNYYSNPIATNCILWGNSSRERPQIYGSSTVTYSCIQGGYPGQGNIDVDPLFVDPNGSDGIFGTEDDNLRLLPGSPCIDVGDNSVVDANSTDLDGNPRILDGDGDGEAIVDMGVYEFFSANTPPVANAGQDQAVYTCASEMAEVQLDGSDSNDVDGDELTYLWTWTIDANEMTATGVDPNIMLGVGVHEIELVVNDGTADSEPDEVVITVIEPVEADVHIVPRVINRRSHMKRIIAIMRLPEDIAKSDIADDPFVLYPGESDEGIEATWQRVSGWGNKVTVFALFDKDELMDAVPDNDRVELIVVGRLESGQYIYGSDTVRIIQPGRQRGWGRRRRQN